VRGISSGRAKLRVLQQVQGEGSEGGLTSCSVKAIVKKEPGVTFGSGMDFVGKKEPCLTACQGAADQRRRREKHVDWQKKGTLR